MVTLNISSITNIYTHPFYGANKNRQFHIKRTINFVESYREKKVKKRQKQKIFFKLSTERKVSIINNGRKCKIKSKNK